MTMIILGGNQRKAERIARDLVKDLTVADVGATVAESMSPADENRLCNAVDEDFSKHERRILSLEKTIAAALSEDIGKLFEEYSELHITVTTVRQKAEFALGYATALRLIRTQSKRP